MATDSIVTHNGIRYTMHRTIKFDPDCNAAATTQTINPQYPVWAGYEVIKRIDSTDVFSNRYGQNITIDSRAKIGDTWKWFVDSAGTVIYATVVSMDTATIWGSVVDSVKTIQLLVPYFMSHEMKQWDSTELKLSANHGLLTAPIFLEFPKNTELLRQTHRQPHTYGDMYSYGIGDYYQLRKKESDYSTDQIYYEYYEVLDKSYYNGGNSITFTFHRERQKIINYKVYPIITDTITVSYDHLSSFVGSGVPEQGVSRRIVSIDYLEDTTGSNLLSLRRQATYNYGIYSTYADSCRNLAWLDIDLNYATSYECLGKLSYAVNPTDLYSESVVYANVCGNVFGSKVVLEPTSINDISILGSIELYPNPATNILMIKNPSAENIRLAIFNLQGQQFGEYLIGTGDSQLDIGHCPVGYHLAQFSILGETYYQKIVIAR